MPARLRPTAPIAPDAILVGDPGRALMLAQELLEQPKMSNHARGLWGYSGRTPAGRLLTIQSTGMGGPSATVVVHDLAELGVRRAIRIGTCTSLGRFASGEIAVATEARPFRGSFVRPDRTKEPRKPELPDAALTQALRARLEEARVASVVSLDELHDRAASPELTGEVADMQTAALLAAGSRLGVAMAAGLIVSRGSDGRELRDSELAEVSKRAGEAARDVLST